MAFACPAGIQQGSDASGVSCSYSLHQPRLRITPAGAEHVLHYDESYTLLVQMQGTKNVTLVPVMQLAYLYPYAEDHILNRRAQVDLAHPDYDKFPLARELTPVTLTMAPGDILVIPRRCSPRSRSVTTSVSISLRVKLNCQQGQDAA